jgi:hypothetical protein
MARAPFLARGRAGAAHLDRHRLNVCGRQLEYEQARRAADQDHAAREKVRGTD